MREGMWNGEFVLMSVDGADKLDDCGCDEGAWMSLDSQCYECGEGMLCKGLGKVILMEGYFAPSDNAGDVWKCHGIEERCPCGAPGTCAKKRLNTSLACGKCEVGTRATTSGECDKCGSDELGLFVLVALAFLVFLCVVYFMTATENRAKQKESIALVAIMVSQIVTAVQVLGVFDLLLVMWPEPFASVLAFGSLLHFDYNVLSPSCVVSTSPLMTYGMTVFGFVLVFAILILIHCVSVFHGGRLTENATPSRKTSPF